jgi:hypothetical protein
MTAAERELLTKVYDLVGGIRGDMTAGFKELGTRLSSLETYRAVTETTASIQDDQTAQRISAFRWRAGMAVTLIFSGISALLAAAHVVLGFGA